MRPIIAIGVRLRRFIQITAGPRVDSLDAVAASVPPLVTPRTMSQIREQIADDLADRYIVNPSEVTEQT